MTKIQWDASGSRKYETGVDRGVLYLNSGIGVPWNGLVSVEEDNTDATVEEYYLDGVKYLSRRLSNDYTATLQAITYPDQFIFFDGQAQMASGIFADDQAPAGRFGLCYRTLVGNDTNPDAGYKLHLLYSLIAKPANQSFGSKTNSASPTPFSWTISGKPKPNPGFRPTSHIVIDSTQVRAGVMAVLENALYGTSVAAPYLPDPAALLALEASV